MRVFNWFGKGFLAVLLIAPLSAYATDVTIDGSVGFDASSGQVTITADQVTNNTSDTTSGTLFLTLWATASSSPSGSGYELASVQLGELAPNEYFYDIVQTTSFSPPPDGTYYIHLLLSEYPNTDGYIDYVTFPGTETFSGGGDSGGGGGGGDSGGSGEYISIGGSVSYEISGGMATMEVDEVVNNSSRTTSGTLYLKLWATAGSSPVGSGYELASSSLGTLSPGQYYYDIAHTVDFVAPPEGTYYVHLIVTEYPDTNTILDSVTFSGTEYFAGSSGGGDGGDDGDDGEDDSGGDDGGGGALHPLWLLAIGSLIACIRRRRTRD